jgi:hypothetical protein
MRIWDLPPEGLCRPHLLGEHRELHAIWAVLTEGRTGYAHHPEVLRWRGRLRALWLRHEAQATEMAHRGWTHASPLDEALATGSSVQDAFVDTPEAQVRLLRAKGCGCRLPV